LERFISELELSKRSNGRDAGVDRPATAAGGCFQVEKSLSEEDWIPAKQNLTIFAHPFAICGSRWGQSGLHALAVACRPHDLLRDAPAWVRVGE
jgi:hypothetical protein